VRYGIFWSTSVLTAKVFLRPIPQEHQMDWVYGITQTPVKGDNRLFLSGSWGTAASSTACEVAKTRAALSKKGFSSPIFVVFSVTLLMTGFFGCATHDSTSAAHRPGSGVAEYQQITSQAQKAVISALNSLEKVSAHTNNCPPNVRASLANEAQRLQVDSLQIRARAQAIQARGDAYFADWSETLKQIDNPGVREAAERNHSQLEQSFSQIKLASQQAGAAFKPFLSGLRQLHINLDKDASAAGSSSGSDLLKATRDHGQEVLKQLGVITNELHGITRMLTPTKSSSKN
jgi:hypothetical protein